VFRGLNRIALIVTAPVDFRSNVLSCFEASVAMQKQATRSATINEVSSN